MKGKQTMSIKTGFKFAMLFMASAASAWASGNSASASAEQLIKNLYALDAKRFEHGVFDGKFNPQRQCTLYREFFSEPLIRFEKPDCSIVNNGYGRYVAVDVLNIGQFGGEIPKASVKKPLAQDEAETAIPVVFSDDTRIVYFVKGTQDTARIVNMLVSSKWPPQPNEEANDLRCPFAYAVMANRFEASLISADCRDHTDNARQR